MALRLLLDGARRICAACGERNFGYDDYVGTLKDVWRLCICVEVLGRGLGNGMAARCRLSC